MWKCTVCKKENEDHFLCCQCGYDRSVGYEHFCTITQLASQDIQKYQSMKKTAQNTIKPKEETNKPVVERPKAEVSKPVAEKPKEEFNKPTETHIKEESIKTGKLTVFKKIILPKTKLDWITLFIGVVMLCFVVEPYDILLANFFDSEDFCEPLSEFFGMLDWNALFVWMVASYVLMFISLKMIQYKKKKVWIIVYVISSIIPSCVFCDIVWGYIISIATYEVWYYITDESMSISWCLLHALILFLAFREDPTKSVVKQNNKKLSFRPETNLQKLVVIIGVVLVIIFACRSDIYCENIDIENIEMWKQILFTWVLMYWLGKRLRYTHKFFKVASYTCFSLLSLFVISDTIWSTELLSQFTGSDGSLWVLFYIGSWILVIAMAIKEEQL